MKKDEFIKKLNKVSHEIKMYIREDNEPSCRKVDIHFLWELDAVLAGIPQLMKELIEDRVNSRVSEITSKIEKNLPKELTAPYEMENERLKKRIKDLEELTQRLMRGQGVKPPAQKDINLDELRELYAQGLSLNEIGRRMGRSPHTVKKYLIRLGLLSK